MRARLSKLPDLEKLLARIFTYSIKHSVKAIYFEDVSLQKMREFRTLLLCFKQLDQTLDSFLKLKRGNQLNENGRIFQLLHPTEEGGLLPDGIPKIIKEFEQLIIWKPAAGNSPGQRIEIPEPQRGIDDEFDNANDQVDAVKAELDEYLDSVKSKFRERRIIFSHAKDRYSIEIPEEHVKGNKKPKDFEFSSSRTGYQRFVTPETKALVDKLERAEEALKDSMAPFLTAIFQKFHSHKATWLQCLSVITELDCLASLAIISGQSDTPMCRPTFVTEKEGQFLNIKQMVHPCVTMTGSKNFIPNDTLIDTVNNQSLLLVTGPNMGGKSTLLRQTCIAVILA